MMNICIPPPWSWLYCTLTILSSSVFRIQATVSNISTSFNTAAYHFIHYFIPQTINGFECSAAQQCSAKLAASIATNQVSTYEASWNSVDISISCQCWNTIVIVLLYCTILSFMLIEILYIIKWQLFVMLVLLIFVHYTAFVDFDNLWILLKFLASTCNFKLVYVVCHFVLDCCTTPILKNVLAGLFTLNSLLPGIFSECQC